MTGPIPNTIDELQTALVDVLTKPVLQFAQVVDIDPKTSARSGL